MNPFHYLRQVLAALLLIASPLGLQADDYNPVASPDAVVQSGRMRFTVLTPQLIRIQYSRTSQFEDRATFVIVNRNLPVPAFTTREEDGYLYINTEALELRYRIGSTPSATARNGNSLSIRLNVAGREVTWYPGKDDALNLKGTTRTLDQVTGDSNRGELENGILSRDGWAVVDESPQTKRGDGSTTFAFDRLTVDVFKDTFKAEYLGNHSKDATDVAAGIVGDPVIELVGHTIRVKSGEKLTVEVFGADTLSVARKTGTDVTVTLDRPGIYVLKLKGQHTQTAKKICLN